MSGTENGTCSLVLRCDVFVKFQALSLKTKLNFNRLLEYLMGLHERSTYTSENTTKVVTECTISAVNGLDTSSETITTGAMLKHQNEKQVQELDADQHLRKTRQGSRKTKKVAASLKNPKQDRSVDELSNTEGITTFPNSGDISLQTPVTPPDSDVMISRRSSRKPSSPKRKQLERSIEHTDKNSSTDIVCLVDGSSDQTMPATPKSRRKNRPHKLVQSEAADGELGSDGEEHLDASTFLEPCGQEALELEWKTLSRERRSKTKAKAVISEIAENVLSKKGHEEDSAVGPVRPQHEEEDNGLPPNLDGHQGNATFVLDNVANEGETERSYVPQATWTILEYNTLEDTTEWKEEETQESDACEQFVCGLCEEVFQSRTNFLKHAEQAHSHENQHTQIRQNDRTSGYEKCNLTSLNKSKRKGQMIVHSEGVDFSSVMVDTEMDPQYPGNKFKAGTNMAKPIDVGKQEVHRKSKNRKQFQCNKCQASFHRRFHLTRHVERMHDGGSQYACKGCGKSVKSPLLLMYHEGLSCKVLRLPFQCDACKVRFESEELLSDHPCSGNPAKPFRCADCLYKTASPWDLQQHIQIHTGVKQFKCDKCQFTSAWRKNLKDHMLIHLDVKPFVCEICGFSSKDPHNLRAHRTTHLTEKNFMCEVCGRKFRAARLLRNHQTVHKDQKPFSCTLCKYTCKRKSTLKSHLNSHSNMKLFICEQCGKHFRTDKYMKKHLEKAHNATDLTYCCKVCDFKAASSQSLNSHMRKHVKCKPKSLNEDSQIENTENKQNSIDFLTTSKHTGSELLLLTHSHNETSQGALSSPGVDLIPAVEKALEAVPSGSSDDLNDLRTLSQEHLLYDQLSVAPGDVLAVLPCLQSGASIVSNQSELTRPQYDQLLFNSNASQAETISTMMNLIRECRPPY